MVVSKAGQRQGSPRSSSTSPHPLAVHTCSWEGGGSYSLYLLAWRLPARPPTQPTRFVDLGEGAQVTGVQIYNRVDCCSSRLIDMEVRLGDADPTVPMNSLITANPLLVSYKGPPVVVGGGQVSPRWQAGGLVIMRHPGLVHCSAGCCRPAIHPPLLNNTTSPSANPQSQSHRWC